MPSQFAYSKQPWDRVTWESLTPDQQQVVKDMNRDMLLEEYPGYAVKSQRVDHDIREPDVLFLTTLAYDDGPTP